MSPRHRPLIIALGLMILGLSAGLLYWSSQTATPQLPDPVLEDLQGQPASLRQWAGEVVLVNFWASWCQPCRKEIPGLVNLQQELGPQGLRIVGIALDHPAQAAALGRELGINYPSLISPEDPMTLMAPFGNRRAALPHSALFNRHGELVFSFTGLLPERRAAELIRPWL